MDYIPSQIIKQVEEFFLEVLYIKKINTNMCIINN